MSDITIKLPDSKNAQAIKEALSNEQTLEALGKMLSRLEKIEESLAQLTVAIEQAPDQVSSIADFVDTAAWKAQERGIYWEERFSGVVKLLEKLTEPKVLDQIHALVAFSEQLPEVVADTTNLVDQEMGKWVQEGADPEKMIQVGGSMLKMFGLALQDTYQSSVEVKNGGQELGLFGFMRRMNKPENRKMLGFLASLLENMGSRLNP